MPKPKKMRALKPFQFNGEMTKVDQDIEPDNEEQAKLLETLGFATSKSRPLFRSRSMRVDNAAVMAAPTQSE